jgi:hypothetical protein
MELMSSLQRRLLIAAGIILLLVIGIIDGLTPWDLGFASLYLIPVILVGVAVPLAWGLLFAAAADGVIVWLDNLTRIPYSQPGYRWWDAFNHFLPLLAAILLIHVLKKGLEREHEAKLKLEATLSEVQELRQILPICAWCGKTRNDQGYWERLDRYLARTTRTKMTHGICPECHQKLQQEFEEHGRAAP